MAQIDSLEVRIEANASTAAAQVSELSSKLRQAGKAISEVAQQSSRLEKLTKVTANGKTGYASSIALSYSRGIQKLKEYNTTLDALRKKQASIGKQIDVKDALGVNADKERIAYGRISRAIDDVIAKRNQYANMKTFRRTNDSTETKTAKAEEQAAEAARIAAERHERLRSALDSTKAAFKRIWSAISTATSHLWKFIFALNGSHKSSEKSGNSFKKLAKFLIRYGFGMRSFFFLFRRLRRGMKEGFEHLGTYSTEAEQAIYGLKASVETLKNAFAAGFSNLLGPVTNFLQGVINAIASALNAIGRFIAALGGKGFAIQAIKVSADEMKALDKNTGGAASSAKKLDKALSVLPFDELNQLNGDKNSSGSGGGGGGASAKSLSASQMFETVALDGEEYIQQLGQRIREAFLSKDWQTLGEVLADPINKFIDNLYDKLNWEKNKPKIKAFTDGVTQTFNSLVKNVNWEKIGLTISSAINDITGAITGLVDGTDWGTLGSKIGTAFNTLLNNTDWAALGKTVFSKIKVVLETAAGFIETTDWSAVGTAFGNFILGALENINLPKIGTTLAHLLNGAMEAAIALLQSGAVGKIVSDLGDMLVNFAENVDWENVGYTIGQALASIDWGKAIADVATAIWKAFTGLLGGLAESDGGLIAILLGGGFIGGRGGSAIGGMALGKVLTNPVGLAIATLLTGGYFTFKGIETFKDVRENGWYGEEEGEEKNAEKAYKDLMRQEIKELGAPSKTAFLMQTYGQEYEKWYHEVLVEMKRKNPWDAIGKHIDKAAKKQAKNDSIPKAARVIMDETAKAMESGGKNAVDSFGNGLQQSNSKNTLQTIMNGLASTFDISAKTKAKGASATSSWFTGANQKYNNEVSSELSTLTDKFAKKYNKDSTIKGYGASGAKSWINGANGYKVPENAFSSLFGDIKTAMLSDSAKKTLTDAGQSLAGWVVGGFKSVAFPPLSISVSSSQLGTDAERAEQLSRRNAGRATSIISNAVKIGWFGKGGLFDSSTIIGYGVGEAGKEAIIPLENRRTMGMIADSILGGYGTQGIADQIVRGVTEAMMMASRSQQINVNATLYTEDNEVLARAVNKGNRAITYRESALAYSGV